MVVTTLQYFRGVAALMVAVYHLNGQTERFGYSGYWPHWAAAGVDLFFVLSGFLMWAITAERSQTPAEFFRRRIARIVPLYWAITTVIIAVMLFAPRLMMTGVFDLGQAVGSYLFVPVPDVYGKLSPVVRVGWTLNIEMMFYLVFAASLFAPRRFRGLIIAAVVFSIVSIAAVVFPSNKWAVLYASSVWFEFLYGMAVAEIYRRGYLKNTGAALSWFLLVLGAAALPFTSAHAPLRGVFVGLPAAAIFIGMLGLDSAARQRPWPWLKLLGDASYSLYLTHLLSFSVAFQAWRMAGASLSLPMLWIFIPMALAWSIAVALLVYSLVEIPLTGYFQSRGRARRHAVGLQSV